MGVLDEFTNEYNKYKSLRNLIYRQNIGNVDLTLSFQNGDFNFNVSPIQATIIQLFGGEDDEVVSKSLSELQHLLNSETDHKLNLSREDLKKACNFWVSKGVIVEKQSHLLSVNTDEVVY